MSTVSKMQLQIIYLAASVFSTLAYSIPLPLNGEIAPNNTNSENNDSSFVSNLTAVETSTSTTNNRAKDGILARNLPPAISNKKRGDLIEINHKTNFCSSKDYAKDCITMTSPDRICQQLPQDKIKKSGLLPSRRAIYR